MKKLFAVLMVVSLVVMLTAAVIAYEKPQDDIVLTVKGDTAAANVEGNFAFDLEMLEKLGTISYDVTDPWMGKQAYGGVPVSKVLDHVGVPGAAVDSISVVASDGKKVELSLEDVYNYDIIFVTKLGDDHLPGGQGGPVKLAFPYDHQETVKEKYDEDYWSWWVETVEVTAGTPPAPPEDIKLTVVGGAINNTDDGFAFDVASLEALGIVEYEANDPWFGSRKYGGPRIIDVLRHVGYPGVAEEVILVASDGWERTVWFKDLQEFPIILATIDNESPLADGRGGPIKPAYPNVDYPEVEETYDQDKWFFWIEKIILPE